MVVHTCDPAPAAVTCDPTPVAVRTCDPAPVAVHTCDPAPVMVHTCDPVSVAVHTCNPDAGDRWTQVDSRHLLAILVNTRLGDRPLSQKTKMEGNLEAT